MIYMDNAAIQKPKIEVVNTVLDVLKNKWYNASSIYENGLESKRIVEHTRSLIADEINCSTYEIIFTSSGSESNSLACDGFLKANNKYNFFITSNIEHSSIDKNKNGLKLIDVDEYGNLSLNKIKGFAEQFNGLLFSLQMANSEIGTIQDIKTIAKIIHDNGCYLHVDAVQCFGHIKIDVKDLGVDMLSATSQKIGGILGSAFLYVKNGVNIESIIYGTQENGLRGSTYNTPAIAGFGKAIEMIDYDIEKEIRGKRDYFINRLLDIPNVFLNGSVKNRLNNNINICINCGEIDNQQLLALLELEGYLCSASTACSAGSKDPSKVLLAIGLTPKEANHSIRITLSNETTYEEIDKFIETLQIILTQFIN